MKNMECAGFQIRYVDKDEPPVDAKVVGTGFVIAKTECHNMERIHLLRNIGYRFHDRVLRAEISLEQNKRLEECKSLIRFPIKVSCDYAKDIYDIACRAYGTDRRFHLYEDFNQELANNVIYAYMSMCRKENMKIVRCIHEDITLGVIILRENGNGTMDNVLGAVQPTLQGKMAAYSLYVQTLLFMQENGYQKYYGNVSASNVGSLNIHTALGAKIIDAEDEYIIQEGL